MSILRMPGTPARTSRASSPVVARGDAARAPRRVHVRIVHDDLANARSPVLVGHYDHDVIVAAELSLDRQVAGRLSELHRMDLYAGPLRTATVVLSDRDPGGARRHPGAIVAGLGAVGELTPGSLAATLEQALTAYGEELVHLERRRRRGGEPRAAGTAVVRAPVTAVLVGSGEAGVTLSDSVQALLRAVAAANARLARAGPAPRRAGPDGLTAFIGRVEIFELYEDRAIEAVYALRSAARPEELHRFLLASRLTHGRQGLQRPRYGNGQAWWQRIRVTADEHGALAFESLTQLARAQASLTSTQRGLVDALVERATAAASLDPTFGHTLFDLLVPNDLKAYAPDRRKLVLVLDPRAAALPWELLSDRHDAGAAPLSVHSGMVRQLLTARRRDRVSRAMSPAALVVGNPPVRDPRFANLPGAAAEADAVAAQLARAGYQVRALTGRAADPVAVLSALHERPWRVVHLAAHGVFEHRAEPNGPAVTGLVLDAGVVLSPADVEQMRDVPDVVFVNGCHLGRMRTGRPAGPMPRLAANLAAQFIEMGVRAVVAAGWAVDDRAARAFAVAFYTELFDGRAFGDAVAAARRLVYREYRDTATWGAYQCYGDPGFALAAARPSTKRERWAAWSEAARWIDEVASEASRGDEAGRPAAIAAIEAGLAAMPAPWRGEPRLMATAAVAFGTLGDHARAIACGPALMGAERAGVPLDTLDQLAGFTIARAGELARIPVRTPQASTLLDKAELLLQALLAIGRTARRCSLLGSLHRQRACIARGGRRRRRALEAMADAYGEAVRIAGGADGGRELEDVFTDAHAERLAALAILCRWPGPARRHATLARQIRTGVAALRTLPAPQRTWARPDYLLAAALLRGTVGVRGRRQLVQAFRDADRASALSHRTAAARLSFIARMIPAHRNPGAARVRRLLRDLTRNGS